MFRRRNEGVEVLVVHPGGGELAISAYPGEIRAREEAALRRSLGINGPDAWGYVSNLTLAYNSSYLQVYDDQDNEIDSGTQFPVSNVPPLYVEGIAHSGEARLQAGRLVADLDCA